MNIKSGKLEQLSLHVFDLLLWIILVPFLITILLPLCFYKMFVRVLIYFFRKDLEFITTVDSLLVRNIVMKETICDIGIIMKIAGPLPINELKDRFRQVLKPNTNVTPSNPLYRLHCRLTTFCGYICTQAVEIDVEKQIYEEEFPEKCSPPEFFSNWFGRPYRGHELPRWEMVLVVDKTQGCSYLGLRANHGLVDGAGLNLIRDLLCGSKTPDPGALPESAVSGYLDKLKLWFILPREVIRFFFTTSPVDSVGKAEERNQTYMLVWTSMKLNRILAIRRKLGIGFGPLLYSLQAEALILYMMERLKGVEMKEVIPALYTIPRDVPHPGGIRNHFSVVRLDLPYKQLALNSVERAIRVNELYQRFLERRWHTLGLEYVSMVANIFSYKVHPLNSKSRMSLFHLHLGNMKLSPEPYSILGRRMENIFPVTTLSSTCPDAVLLTDCLSRGDMMDISHVGSSRIFRTREDLEFFAHVCFPKAVEALEH